MELEKCYMILPDVRFGTSDLFVEEVEVIDTYMKHVDPIAKVYVNESLGTVFMPLSMLYSTRREALFALKEMCQKIANRTTEELEDDNVH